jgi:hypothetical protein
VYVQADDRLELQNSGTLRKIDQRHAVSENVVDPANLGRIRRHRKARNEQALIETIAGPEQHLMPARPYRLLVPIRRRVMDAENRHSGKGPVPASTLASEKALAKHIFIHPINQVRMWHPRTTTDSCNMWPKSPGTIIKFLNAPCGVVRDNNQKPDHGGWVASRGRLGWRPLSISTSRAALPGYLAPGLGARIWM